MNMKIKYKKVRNNASDLVKTEKGDWIDLSVSRIWVNDVLVDHKKFDTVWYDKDTVIRVDLGIAMELPPRHEAHVLPRSSLFTKKGLILVNSMGIIDNKYSGDRDEWFAEFYALKNGSIKVGERIAQFRIVANMDQVPIELVKHLGNPDRGGHGSTGD